MTPAEHSIHKRTVMWLFDFHVPALRLERKHRPCLHARLCSRYTSAGRAGQPSCTGQPRD